MKDPHKYLGRCIVFASFVLASAIVWHSRVGRYQGEMEIIDTVTGEMRALVTEKTLHVFPSPFHEPNERRWTIDK